MEHVALPHDGSVCEYGESGYPCTCDTYGNWPRAGYVYNDTYTGQVICPACNGRGLPETCEVCLTVYAPPPDLVEIATKLGSITTTPAPAPAPMHVWVCMYGAELFEPEYRVIGTVDGICATKSDAIAYAQRRTAGAYIPRFTDVDLFHYQGIYPGQIPSDYGDSYVIYPTVLHIAKGN